jgi:hypothetical protein
MSGAEFKLRAFSAGSILTFRKQNRATCFHDLAGANATEDTAIDLWLTLRATDDDTAS